MFIMCGGCMVLFNARSEQNYKDYQANHQRLETELPDDSTGHQWVKASTEAKEDLIDRVGPSWTSISHSDVLKHVNYYFSDDRVEILRNDRSKLVRDVIAKYANDKDDAHDARVRDHLIRRANETNDPAERQERLRRALENSR